jgi:ABC-2 type transport system permease protein
MDTNSTLDRNTVLAARRRLVAARSDGGLSGFSNMLAKELGDWFGSRRWFVRTIVWLAIINGLMAFIMFVMPAMDPSEQTDLEEQLGLYFSLAIQAGAIGMIILTQDEIIQEKQSGTAEWILSKPVARNTFVLTKLLSNFLGGLIFIAGLPGIVAYAEFYFASQRALPILPYLMGVGLILLTLTFYLSMVIMLGTIFEQRGAVLGIALVGVLIGGVIVSQFIPLVPYLLPVGMPNIAVSLIQGQPLQTIAISEMITASTWSILFTLVALWRFGREEF